MNRTARLGTYGVVIVSILLAFVAGRYTSRPPTLSVPPVSDTQNAAPLAASLQLAGNPQSALQEPRAEDRTSLVTRAVDGDTIELQDGTRVRYIGIDTPESVDPRKPVQCFGVEAAKQNKSLVEGKRVRLEKDISETDRYGRLLRYVYVGDTFVNLELVRSGFAHASPYPPDVRHEADFRAAESEARMKGRGLWTSCPASNDTSTSKTPQPQGNTAPQETVAAPPRDSSCVIKGNISAAGEKIYHVPGCDSYEKTAIDESRGERWFCSESEAATAGWRKAKNCP